MLKQKINYKPILELFKIFYKNDNMDYMNYEERIYIIFFY